MRFSPPFICVYLCSSVVPFIWGCGGPNQANIVVRKQNQELRDEIDRLNRVHQADVAQVRSLQEQTGKPPGDQLPTDRIDKLFTTHGLKLGRLTGGAKLNPQSSADDAVKVYVVPTDDFGQPLKAAGSFVIEVFDLNEPEKPLLARREFSTDEARKQWFGEALLYEFVLACPLSTAPKHNEVTVKVSFTDELTRRRFDVQQVVRVTPPDPTTRPATNALAR